MPSSSLLINWTRPCWIKVSICILKKIYLVFDKWIILRAMMKELNTNFWGVWKQFVVQTFFLRMTKSTQSEQFNSLRSYMHRRSVYPQVALTIRSSHGPEISSNLSDYGSSGKAPWWGIVSLACLEKLAAAWKMDGVSTPSCLSLIRCHPRSASMSCEGKDDAAWTRILRKCWTLLCKEDTSFNLGWLILSGFDLIVLDAA